ncbi:MAG: ATP synthase F1 subunit gamma [Opitutales bacterium]|nr:ATP synthase F1 subunit gamma [Opitutales bacterium]
MKGMREIRSRIKAVKSTGQITRAMQLVAASKMKKAQNRAESGRDYTLMLMDLIDILDPMMAAKIREVFGERKPQNRRLIIVFSTDKGLCGALNTNLFKRIMSLEGDCSYVAVGAKAAKFISATRRKLLAQFKISDNLAFSEIRPIVEFAIKEYAENRADTIEVLYPAFINTIKQEPELVKIAPIDDLDGFIERMKIKYRAKSALRKTDAREIHFEPSLDEILRELPAYYMKNVVYHLALDAKASEQSARMVAMKGASDNAENLMASLTLEYNKARQSAITTEITEIAAAAAISGQ